MLHLPDVSTKSSRTVIAQPGLRYAQAAEATEDVCLREIWEELSAAEYRHARQLLSLLEQMVLA